MGGPIGGRCLEQIAVIDENKEFGKWLIIQRNTTEIFLWRVMENHSFYEVV